MHPNGLGEAASEGRRLIAGISVNLYPPQILPEASLHVSAGLAVKRGAMTGQPRLSLRNRG
jgi:hypothetical protein